MHVSVTINGLPFSTLRGKLALDTFLMITMINRHQKRNANLNTDCRAVVPGAMIPNEAIGSRFKLTVV